MPLAPAVRSRPTSCSPASTSTSGTLADTFVVVQGGDTVTEETPGAQVPVLCVC